MENIDSNLQLPKKSYIHLWIISTLIILVVGYFMFSAPFDSIPTTIHISKNESLESISSKLEKNNSVRSAFVLKRLVEFFDGDKQISKGDYYFPQSSPVWRIAWMLSTGDHNINPIKITFPEGINNEQILNLLTKRMPDFNKDVFDKLINGKQGYLFPDTYFFYPLSTEEEVFQSLSDNFNKKISSLDQDISQSGHSRSDIIRMASILEREARGQADSEIVAGILWKRIKLKMPLQVDAAPDTYKEIGLPHDPIANPGLVAIKASIYYRPSPYLFYLHDKNGTIHFATTFIEHKKNIATYLK